MCARSGPSGEGSLSLSALGMYGHLNQITKLCIIENYGEEGWKKVVKLSKTEGDYEERTKYNDDNLEKLIGAATKVLDVPREQFLEKLGGFYFAHLRRIGHDAVLRNLGGNLLEFLQNVDSIHAYQTTSFPDMDAPSFRCEADSVEDRMVLHYYSFRKGYHPMVRGVIKAVAKELYKMKVDFSLKSITTEMLLGKRGGAREHVVYAITGKRFEEEEESAPPTFVCQTRKHGEQQILKRDVELVKQKVEKMMADLGSTDAMKTIKDSKALQRWRLGIRAVLLHKGFAPTYMESIPMTSRFFVQLLPYHIIFSSTLNVLQSGIELQKTMASIQFEQPSLLNFFELVYPPAMDLKFDNVKRFLNSPFVLRIRKEKVTKKTAKPVLLLKGQMNYLHEKDLMLYLCSPLVRSFTDLENRGMTFADIPGHDVTRDMLFTMLERYGSPSPGQNSYSINGQDGAGDSAPPYVEIRRMREELESEKKKNTALLSAFLPRPVVDAINAGRRPEPAEHKDVSILFCDVVQFTKMTARCQPKEIVSMLNELYVHFANVTQVHGTHRVESIGDAYMVIAGAPDSVGTHAERIANTALAIMTGVRTVRSPLTKSEVSIRIGMHTGSVVWGVFGTKVPRFVVMGEAAVIASKMESHGIPGRIHVSSHAYRALYGKGYEFEERGEVDLKWAVNMTTYFLIRNKKAKDSDLIGSGHSGGRKTEDGLILFKYSE